MEGILGIFVFLTCGLCIGALLIYIFFCISYMKVMNEVDPVSRKMQPGLVWLMWIPLFNIYWNFHIVIALAKSLREEFDARRLPINSTFGKSVGLAWAGIGVFSIFLSVAQNVVQYTTPDNITVIVALTIIGFVISIAQLVCFITYWVQIVKFGRELMANRNGRSSSFGDERDDFDDYTDNRRDY